MAVLLARIGRFSFRHRWWVVAAWLLILVGVGSAAAAFKGPTDDQFSIPNSQAQTAIDTLSRELPVAANASAQVVFAPPAGRTVADAQDAPLLADLVREAAGLPGVTTVADPAKTGSLAPDGSLAVVQVTYDKKAADVTADDRDALQALAVPARSAGATVEFGGQVFSSGSSGTSPTEAIGVVVAAVVLIITFGSLAAAGMPLLTGIVGVGIGAGAVTALSGVISLSSTAPVLALMIGLAVGIDYSLFIVSRHRSQLARGMAPEESAALATGTAGSAVVFAGLTVIIALTGLSLVRIPFLTVMGLAAAATVLITVLVALTLVPAMLAVAGSRLTPKPGSRAMRRESDAPTMGSRWVAGVTRRPLLVLVAGVVALGVLAIPVAGLRLGLPDAGTAAADQTQRKAYDLVGERLGAGVNGPLTLVVTPDRGPDVGAAAAAATTVADRVGTLPGVAAVTPAQPAPSGTLAVVSVVPTTGPDAPETADLVHRIRDDGALADGTSATVAVTGQTALAIDVSDALSSALPLFLVVVVGLALLLLGLVFRSIVVPIKAALGFLLTVGSSLGAVVAVFQWGWLAGLVGVDRTGPIISFLPILLVGILFGLAMDYEVFLVSRMREDYVHGTGADAARRAVRSGFSAGARVVTAAALIMTAVFAGFALSPDTIIKPIGFALALGVLIDAFVVRMTLVPAVMTLFGRRAWWLPRWLDRALPNVDIEGEALQTPRPRESVPA